MVDLYREYKEKKGIAIPIYSSRNNFMQKEKEFRLLKDMVSDSYLKQDLSRMYYEMVAEFMPERLNDEIERTQQHLEELKALAKTKEQ